MNRQWLRKGALYTSVLIGGIIAAFVLMVAAYSLPTGRMKMHAKESVEMLKEEGDYPQWASGLIFTTGDQFTDAYMIKAAVIEKKDEGLLEKAMLVPVVPSHPQVDSIENAVDEAEYQMYGYYPRYWHGYLIILKPLLIFFNISEIRILSLFVLFSLLFYALMLIKERLGGFYSFSFFVAILFLNPVTIVLSMIYKAIYYITLITTIALIRLEKKGIDNKETIIFLLDGMCVAFFDYLSYPLIAICLPLTIYLALRKSSLSSMLKMLARSGITWCIGYGGMWAGKWVLANIITGENIIKDGIDRFIFRTSSEYNGMTIHYSDVMDKIFSVFSNPVFLFIIITLAAGIMIYLIRQKKTVLTKQCIPFFIVASFPFLWYALTKNHSYIHPQHAYRELAGTLFSILCIAGMMRRSFPAGLKEIA